MGNPRKSKTKQRMVFRMIHVKDSRSYQWAKFGLWTSRVMVMLPPKRIFVPGIWRLQRQKKTQILDHFPVGQGPLDVVWYVFFSVHLLEKEQGVFFKGELEHNLNLPFQKELFCVALSCFFRNLLRRWFRYALNWFVECIKWLASKCTNIMHSWGYTCLLDTKQPCMTMTCDFSCSVAGVR